MNILRDISYSVLNIAKKYDKILNIFQKIFKEKELYHSIKKIWHQL